MIEPGVPIMIAAPLVNAARIFATRVVQGYVAGTKPRSRALQAPGVPVIWNDPTAQTIGRLGEIALGIFLGVNLDRALDWSARPDAGSDIAWRGHTIDVKTSAHPHASLLLWPATKTFKPRASILVAARVEAHRADYACVRLQGWIPTDDFLARRTVAERHRSLADGTGYLPESRLRQMPTLKEVT